MALSVLHWNEAQVNQFFVSLGLTRYEQAIKDHALTGDVLIHLDNELLKDIGIKSVGKRLTILKAIYKLKLKEDIPIEDGHWTPPLGDMEQDDSEPDTHSDSSPLLATPPTPNQHHHQHQHHPDSLNHLFLIRDQRIKSLESDVCSIKQELQSLSARLLALSSTPNSPCILVDTVSRTSAATRAQDRHMREESICQLDIHDPSLASPALSHTTPIIPSHEDTKPPPSPDPSNQTQEVLQTQMFNNKELSPPPPTTTTSGDTLSIAAATPKPSDRAGSKTTTDNKKTTGTTTTTTMTTTGGKENTTTTQERDAANPYKSFRVTLEDPCYKVLPAALKKYKINEHYKNYVLFICYGKQERCLSYEEKPLLLFQKLKEANQNPVFTLRHIKDIESPVSLALSKQAHRREKKLAAADNLPPNNPVSIPRKTPPNSGRVEKASGFCIAIYPYISEGEEDLDVGVGDTFIIVGKSKGWWVVNRDKGSSTEISEEQQGWIPSGCLLETKKSFSIGTTGKVSYATRILPEEILSVSSACYGLMDYKAKGIDELGFDIKDRLKVYKKYNNWSYAINESRPEKPRGWTPSWLIGTRKDKEGARSTSPVSAPTTSTTSTSTTAAAATATATAATVTTNTTATTNLNSSLSGSSSAEPTTRSLKPSLSSSSSSSLFDRHRPRGAAQHPVSRSSSSTTASIFSDSTATSTTTVTPATSVFASHKLPPPSASSSVNDPDDHHHHHHHHHLPHHPPLLADHIHPLRHPASSSLRELKLSNASSADLANAIT